MFIIFVCVFGIVSCWFVVDKKLLEIKEDDGLWIDGWINEDVVMEWRMKRLNVLVVCGFV